MKILILYLQIAILFVLCIYLSIPVKKKYTHIINDIEIYPHHYDTENLVKSDFKNIHFKSVSLTVNKRFKTNGFLLYEKDKNFRMIQKSFLGTELDMGSNNDHFWFWSKRMKPNHLYYSKHENAMNTGLRTPFNPIWIMEILSLSAEGMVYTYKDQVAVIKEEINTEGRLVKNIKLIDVLNKRIIGYYVYEGDKILVSAEVKGFHKHKNTYIPSKIETIWFEEDMVVWWELNDLIVDSHMDSFIMPNMRDKKELGIPTLNR